MCTNCLPYRDASSQPPCDHGTGPESLIEHLQRPISRRSMLQVAGAGLVAALSHSMANHIGAFAASESKAPHLVLMVLDGARPEYFDVPNIPHVKALIKSGTRYTHAFSGILESETPAAHTAIGTGTEPRKNGIISFAWGEPDQTRVSIFDPVKVRNGAMASIISKSGVPTLAGKVHEAYKGSRVVALSGSKYYAADVIGGPDADFIMYFAGTNKGTFVPQAIPGHQPPSVLLGNRALVARSHNMPRGVENHLAMQLAVNTFNLVRQQVTLINLPEFDWPLGHVDGGIRDTGTVHTLMHQFDKDLAMLQDAYRKAGVLDRTIFVMMGDHGMMPLQHTVSSDALIGAIEAAGTEIVSKAFSTAAYFWVKDPTRRVQAGRNVAALNQPHVQSVYVRAQTSKGYVYQPVTMHGLVGAGAKAANQYLLQTFAGPDGPDIVVLFTEGAGSEPKGQSSWKADHGGANWEAQHLPLIISGPGVRSGHISTSPARLIDVAPTVLQLMEAKHNGMQGVPLADAMTNPPSWAVEWQTSANKKLNPLIASMRKQSHHEIATHA